MGGGLLCGITPYHVRRLCDNPLDGGLGYTPNQVGGFTLDQIYLLLVDRKMLRCKEGVRSREVKPLAVTGMADKQGMLKGRAADGTPIRGRIRGKSKARELMEAQQKGG